MNEPISLNAGPMRLGFGCAGAWAKPWFPEREARAVLFAALEAGLRHVDTAGFYADGEGERRLARALKEFGEPVFVSTKTGTRYRRIGAPVKDFSEAAIRADVEASLARLGRERLDLLYLHGPNDEELSRAAETLLILKKEGKIALGGVCGEGAGLQRALETEGVDVIMGVYNFLIQKHAALFEKAKVKGKGVVAIAPLAQGLYRRDILLPKSPTDAWRAARAFVKNRETLRKAQGAAPLLEGVEGWTPAQIALAFALANPAVDLAVTSTTKPRHLAEALEAARRAPPHDILKKLAGAALDAACNGA